jgi:WD40 repeat protein
MVLNAATLDVVSRDCRAEGWIRDIRFSPDGNQVAAASNDRCVYVYEATGGFKRTFAYKCTCRGHTRGVTHLDFTEDGKHLQSNSAAYELMHWSVATGKQLAHGHLELKDARWASWTCPLGWPVQGLWPEAPDGIEVTAVDRSRDGGLLAAVDDAARLRLYAFPCIVREAKHRGLGGHSPPVSACRWAAKDAFLLTTGGSDRAAFQWDVVGAEAAPGEGEGGYGMTMGAVTVKTTTASMTSRAGTTLSSKQSSVPSPAITRRLQLAE